MDALDQALLENSDPLNLQGTPQPESAPDATSTPQADPLDMGLQSLQKEEQTAQYGTPFQQAQGAAESAASTLTGGLSTGFERLIGVPAEDIRKRAEELNPAIKMTTDTAALLGSGYVGAPIAGALEGAGIAGEAAAEALGLGKVGIGSAAASAAAQNALLGATDEVSKAFANDPDQTVSSAAQHIGLSGLFGAAVGHLGQGTEALWTASPASESTNSVLEALARKYNHPDFEGLTAPAAEGGAASIGRPELNPIAQSGLAPDGSLESGLYKQMMDKEAPKVVKAAEDANGQISRYALKQVGKTDADVADISEASNAQAGGKIGDTLVPEMQDKIDARDAAYEQVKEQIGNAPFKPETPWKDPETGKVSQPDVFLKDKLQTMYDQDYAINPSTPAAKLVKQAIRDVDNIKTLDDVMRSKSNLASWDWKTPEDLMAAKSKMSRIYNESYETGVEQHFQNSPEGQAAVDSWYAAKGEHGNLMDTLGMLKQQLKVSGDSPKTILDNVSRMAEDQPELFAQRMAPTDRANFTQLLQREFPQTAEAVKERMINNLLLKPSTPARLLKPGEVVSSGTISKKMAALTPEVRNFILTPAQQQELGWAGQASGVLNYKGSPFKAGKGLMAVLSHMPAQLTGALGWLLGKNPATGYVLGETMRLLSTKVPDAVRIGLLKFFGTPAAVDSVAFRKMVTFAEQASKGDGALVKSIKNVFDKGSKAVIPELSDNERGKLDKRIQDLQLNPQQLMDNSDTTLAHYLPDSQQSLSKTLTAAATYLNSIRPQVAKSGPLDRGEVSKAAQEQFNRQLDIANNPARVIEHLKQGTLQQQDLNTVNAIYPSALPRMGRELMDQVTKRTAKEEEIPYHVRSGISQILGQPLDSTLSPSSINVAQAVFARSSSQQLQQANTPSRGTPKKLGKTNMLDMTPSQASMTRELQRR